MVADMDGSRLAYRWGLRILGMLFAASIVFVAYDNDIFRTPRPFLGVWSAVFFIGATARFFQASLGSELPLPLPVQTFLVGMVTGAMVVTLTQPSVYPNLVQDLSIKLLILLGIYDGLPRWVFKNITGNARQAAVRQ
ncbi:MAG: hypothetical protein KM310_07660 [Clostridiales bacterium]|nr:hypothetical protein [Clostridiales bacterium]